MGPGEDHIHDRNGRRSSTRADPQPSGLIDGTPRQQWRRRSRLDLSFDLQRLTVLDCLVVETVLSVAGSSATPFPRIFSDDLLLTTGNDKTKKNEQTCEYPFHTSAFCHNDDQLRSLKTQSQTNMPTKDRCLNEGIAQSVGRFSPTTAAATRSLKVGGTYEPAAAGLGANVQQAISGRSSAVVPGTTRQAEARRPPALSPTPAAPLSRSSRCASLPSGGCRGSA